MIRILMWVYILSVMTFAVVGAAEDNAVIILTRDKAVTMAISAAPAIAVKKAMAEAASARIAMARSMTRPGLGVALTGSTADMEMTLQSTPSVGSSIIRRLPPTKNGTASFMMMTPIYTGGKLEAQTQSTRYLEKAASFETSAAELDTSLVAKSAFDQTLLGREYVKAYSQRVEQAEERVRIADVAFEQGRIAKFDLLRNKTDLADAQRERVYAQRDLETYFARLKKVLAVSQTTRIELQGELSFVEIPADGNALAKDAIANRPELRAAAAKVAEARSKVAVARGDFLPQAYGVLMHDVSYDSEMKPESSSAIVLTVSLPLMDGGLRRAAVREAQAMVDAALADERDVKLMVESDVAEALASLNAATQAVGFARTAVDQAEEDYRVVKLRYESGKSINVEVIDAAASLARARTNLADALFQHNLAHSTITRAVGGL